METSVFLNFELDSIIREAKYYSVPSLCEVLYGSAAKNVAKIEKYLLEEQNNFYLGSDFEYFEKLAKSASIATTSDDDGKQLWISIEVLLHVITSVKKGARGRKEYLLSGKMASDLRKAVFELIAVSKTTGTLFIVTFHFEILFKLFFSKAAGKESASSRTT